MHFPGLMPAVLTPFGDDGRVRVDILSEMVAWYVDCGVDGIVGIGTLGEHRSLDADERRAVIAAIVEGTGGRVPVTIGVSAETARDAAVHAVDAARSGAQSLMCLPPLTYHADPGEMVAFYTEVASATDLPLMAYNHPTGGLDDLTPELLARLIEVEHVVAVKESSGEVRRIAAAIEATGGEMEVVAGTDDIALEAYAAGASGWVTGVGDVAPAECVELWRLLEARELEAAQALWLRLLPLARLDTDPKLVQFYKASLDRIGRYGGPTRPPRLPLTADEQARVTAAIEALWGENGGQASVDGDPAIATGSVGER